MPVTCPAGHISESTDYCDTCGAAIEGAPGAAAAGAAAAAADPAAAPAGTAQMPAIGSISPCPNCGAPASVDDAFCEVCGIDFATGELPAKPPPSPDPAPAAAGGATAGAASAQAPADRWVAVIEADRDRRPHASDTGAVRGALVDHHPGAVGAPAEDGVAA